ncbi:MAG: hypothetical protein NZZ41_06300 [Candidatus Dojkabacteria bacterium]|nr:hypothetical protein [Candidatus Dojkabacteria bacterium]
MKKKNNRKFGQILFTTVITLSIILIIFTGLFVLLRTDIRNTFLVNKYEDVYSFTYSTLQGFVQELSQKNRLTVNDVRTFLVNLGVPSNKINVDCLNSLYSSCTGFFLPDELLNNDYTRTSFQIVDLNYIEDLEIQKDEILHFKVYDSGPVDFRGTVHFLFNMPYSISNYLIEVGVVGRNVNTNKNLLWRDYIDLGNLSTPRNLQILPIENLVTDNNSRSVRFVLNMSRLIHGYSNRDSFFVEYVFLVVRSMINSAELNKNIVIKHLYFSNIPVNYVLPPVLRRYTMESVNRNSDDTSVRLVAQVPIFGSLLHIFDNVIYSENEIVVE